MMYQDDEPKVEGASETTLVTDEESGVTISDTEAGAEITEGESEASE